MKNILNNILNSIKINIKTRKIILYCLLLFVIFFILYTYSNIFNSLSSIFSLFQNHLGRTKEGFQWSQYEKDQFILTQHINNPKIIYDLEQLQKYASQEEVDIFLQTGLWPWSEEVENLYMTALEKNPHVRVYKTDGLNLARKIYNQYAILYILNNQEQLEKEYREKNKMIQLTQEDNEENGYGDYTYGTSIIT